MRESAMAGSVMENSNSYDCTTEGALAKLFHLMGMSEDNRFVAEELDKNLRGEITK